MNISREEPVPRRQREKSNSQSQITNTTKPFEKHSFFFLSSKSERKF
jgi:hypothetical protein